MTEVHKELRCAPTVCRGRALTGARGRATYAKIDAVYNPFWGQLFRSGTKHSYFSQMVERFADLYSSNFETLTNYPITYPFLSTAEKLPHEEGL